MAPELLPEKQRWHYAWVVAALTFLILLTAAGVRSAPGVLIVPLERDFGWSRTTISTAISVNLVLYGLIGPFAAALINQIGIRKTVFISLTCVSIGVALTALIHSPWQLILLWGVVVGCGTGMTALVLGAVVVNRWFARHQGTVLGVLTASTATGQLVFLPLLAAIVAGNGWRPAVLLIAGIVALLIPLSMFLRNSPGDLGLKRYGETGSEPAATIPSGNAFVAAIAALRDGCRSKDFWVLAISFFVCGASTNGLIGTHLVPACMDVGIPEVQAASLLAVMGIFDLVGTTASGWLSDRVNNRVLLAWYYGLRGLSLIYLPFALQSQSWGLTLFTVFYGLDWIATVPPTVRLTAQYFGKARAGIMFGWIVAFHQLGAATATFGAAATRSWMGDYQRAFLTSGALCLMTAAMFLAVGESRRETSEGILTQAEPA